MQQVKWHSYYFFLFVLMFSGCTVTEIITGEETKLVIAEELIKEDLLLDIGIIEFADGVPEDNNIEKTRIYENIRKAESRYLAYHLKTTLQKTGHWGAVRVIPSINAFTDIIINGMIENSDGEFIELQITIEDTQGNKWYNKTYEAQTGTLSYSENRDRRNDPYQKVFNDMANDLHTYFITLPDEKILEIRQVSELKFFADMSPLAFGKHLTTDRNNIIQIVRLPAKNDPSIIRLRQMRERDRLVIDMLNEHYANFYYGIAIPYQQWRKISREESINYRQVKRSATIQTLLGITVIVGAIATNTNDNSYSKRQMKSSLKNLAFNQGYKTFITGWTRRSEARMHFESIKELSESFGAEAAPMTMIIKGETRSLTGTAAAQYESWRRLLRQIYEEETGFIEDSSMVISRQEK